VELVQWSGFMRVPFTENHMGSPFRQYAAASEVRKSVNNVEWDHVTVVSNA
jgi:hypothetical protein